MDGLFNLTRPPKPSAEGSNPSAPARKTALLRAVLFFIIKQKDLKPKGARAVKSNSPVDCLIGEWCEGGY